MNHVSDILQSMGFPTRTNSDKIGQLKEAIREMHELAGVGNERAQIMAKVMLDNSKTELAPDIRAVANILSSLHASLGEVSKELETLAPVYEPDSRD